MSKDDKMGNKTVDQHLTKIHDVLRELTMDELRQLVSEFKSHELGDTPTYFSCGADRAEFDFEDDETALAFAHQLARKMCFFGFDVGELLQVSDADGEVLAKIPLQRPLH
jgi:hypothetical protein